MYKYIVKEAWERSYTDPINIQKGENVIMDLSEIDNEWENWVWCISSVEKNGWVPTQILKVIEDISDTKKRAFVLKDYSANELTIQVNDILIGNEILNGWLWCCIQGSDIKGWVPLENIQQMK